MPQHAKHHAKENRPVTKGRVLCDSVFMKCAEQANL